MTEDTLAKFTQTIDEAIALLGGTYNSKALALDAKIDLQGLITDCLELCDEITAQNQEPIRTIHHLSCTGGTLFAKCIAAMPNVLLLNEVDPLSPLPLKDGKAPFTPSDMISLLRQGDPKTSPELLKRLFQRDIGLICQEQTSIGNSLVLRDHSHSHFLNDNEVSDRPTLREIIAEKFPIKSILTVRDPIDSYLSMKTHGWHEHFSPPTFDEYCRRYLLFLEKHEGVEIIKYEDFVANPSKVMQKICKALELDYSGDFQNLFSAFQFSGDSGRSGNVIEARPRRGVEEVFLEEVRRSDAYFKLISQLIYKKIKG